MLDTIDLLISFERELKEERDEVINKLKDLEGTPNWTNALHNLYATLNGEYLAYTKMIIRIGEIRRELV